jgi:hypothetical protein
MKNSIITIAVLMLILGCKKERIQYISDDIKQNYFYKPGSYWIYRDSVTGREDSCYVLSYSIDLVDINDRSTSQDYDKYESLKINMRVATLGISYKYSITTFIKDDNISYMLGGNSGFKVFGCPLPINSSSINTSRYKGLLEFFKSINLQGKEFINTLKYNTNGGGFCYINESVGLIKLKTSLDSSNYNYELLRYNIIK